MMEALQALAAEKGISIDTLLGALADALESAYKRMPGAYEYAWVTIDPDTVEIRVDRPGRSTRTASPSATSSTSPPTPRHRPHRRPDRPPGDDAAPPRGRPGHEVRGVRRPRGRHRHRHHPAERQPLHAARPRPGRGAAAPGRAGALRAPRAQHPAQGLHRRGPQDRRRARRSWSAAPTPASSSGSSSSRCPRSPTASSRSRPAPASPATARRSRSGRTTPTSTRSAPASAPVAPASAWSSTSSRARRSTSSRSPTDSPDFVAKALSPAKVKEVRIDEDDRHRPR